MNNLLTIQQSFRCVPKFDQFFQYVSRPIVFGSVEPSLSALLKWLLWILYGYWRSFCETIFDFLREYETPFNLRINYRENTCLLRTFIFGYWSGGRCWCRRQMLLCSLVLTQGESPCPLVLMLISISPVIYWLYLQNSFLRKVLVALRRRMQKEMAEHKSSTPLKDVYV